MFHQFFSVYSEHCKSRVKCNFIFLQWCASLAIKSGIAIRNNMLLSCFFSAAFPIIGSCFLYNQFSFSIFYSLAQIYFLKFSFLYIYIINLYTRSLYMVTIKTCKEKKLNFFFILIGLSKPHESPWICTWYIVKLLYFCQPFYNKMFQLYKGAHFRGV